MRMFKKDEGFTLVELMVVVLIIGILVAIAIPVFNAASGSARAKTCVANLRTLDGAVQQWKAAEPTNTVGITGVSDTAANMKTTLTAYVKTFPVCPTDKVAYTFTSGTELWGCTNFAAATPAHKY